MAIEYWKHHFQKQSFIVKGLLYCSQQIWDADILKCFGTEKTVVKCESELSVFFLLVDANDTTGAKVEILWF